MRIRSRISRVSIRKSLTTPLADDYNDNIRLQGQIAQQQLQQQMDNLAVQGQLQQQRIYEQSLQMRAGGCWYNRSQP